MNKKIKSNIKILVPDPTSRLTSSKELHIVNKVTKSVCNLDKY